MYSQCTSKFDAFTGFYMFKLFLDEETKYYSKLRKSFFFLKSCAFSHKLFFVSEKCPAPEEKSKHSLVTKCFRKVKAKTCFGLGQIFL
jgi:hypothetical protein